MMTALNMDKYQSIMISLHDRNNLILVWEISQIQGFPSNKDGALMLSNYDHLRASVIHGFSLFITYIIYLMKQLYSLNDL